jgi:hypothetical protein
LELDVPVPVVPEVLMPDDVPDEPDVAVPAGMAPAAPAPSLMLPLDVAPDDELPLMFLPLLVPVELHAARLRAIRPPSRMPRYVFMTYSRDG